MINNEFEKEEENEKEEKENDSNKEMRKRVKVVKFKLFGDYCEKLIVWVFVGGFKGKIEG